MTGRGRYGQRNLQVLDAVPDHENSVKRFFAAGRWFCATVAFGFRGLLVAFAQQVDRHGSDKPGEEIAGCIFHVDWF
jgi:hypothetical protein